MSSKRQEKAKLEKAVWDLIDIAKCYGVTFRWKDPDLCDEVWPDAWGTFDCMSNSIILYKRANKPLSAEHVHTFAHELRHAWQFKNKIQPKCWLHGLGLYPRIDTEAESKIIEDDADEWADAFMLERGLPVPTDFDKKNV